MAAHKRRARNSEEEDKTMTINNTKTARMNKKMQAGEASLNNTQAGGAVRSRVKAALCLSILALEL